MTAYHVKMPGSRTQDPIVYLAGDAVENGPARGLPTLYVRAVRPVEEVRAYAAGRRHVVLEVDAPVAGVLSGSAAAGARPLADLKMMDPAAPPALGPGPGPSPGPGSGPSSGSDRPGSVLRAWLVIARACLDAGLWVSVSYRAAGHDRVHAAFQSVWSQGRFIPNASVGLSAHDVSPNQTLTIDQGQGGGGRWSVVLGDLDRAWCWTPSGAARAHKVLAHMSDLDNDRDADS